MHFTPNNRHLHPRPGSCDDVVEGGGGGGVLRPLTVQRYILYLVDVTIILVADSLNKLL